MTNRRRSVTTRSVPAETPERLLELTQEHIRPLIGLIDRLNEAGAEDELRVISKQLTRLSFRVQPLSSDSARHTAAALTRILFPGRLCSGRVTGVPLPKAQPTPSDQRRRHVANGPRCPCLHASAVEGSRAKRPVAKGGPITPCEGRCRRCQQTTRTRVGL
jgi:hypothetical protein